MTYHISTRKAFYILYILGLSLYAIKMLLYALLLSYHQMYREVRQGWRSRAGFLFINLFEKINQNILINSGTRPSPKLITSKLMWEYKNTYDLGQGIITKEYQKRFKNSISAKAVAILAVVTLIKDCYKIWKSHSKQNIFSHFV